MEAISPSSIPSSCTACSPCGRPSGPTRPTAREPPRPPFLRASTLRPLRQCRPAHHPDPHLPQSLAPHRLSSLLPTQLPLSLYTGVAPVVEQGVGRPAQGGPKLPQSSLTLLRHGPPKNVSIPTSSPCACSCPSQPSPSRQPSHSHGGGQGPEPTGHKDSDLHGQASWWAWWGRGSPCRAWPGSLSAAGSTSTVSDHCTNR